MYGYIYIIYDSIFEGFSGPGKTFDLQDSNNYNFRIFAENGDMLGYVYRMQIIDINADGKSDFSVAPGQEVGRNAGLWFIYNFPHSISLNSIADYNSGPPVVSGVVSASNSVSSISGVEYSIDNNAFSGVWNSCSSSGNGFNSTSEAFSCVITTSLASGYHTCYIRAYDANYSYTAISRYVSTPFYLDRTSPSISELYLANVSKIEAGKTYTITNLTPSFSGKASDLYDAQVSSGPDIITLNLKKQSSNGKTFSPYLTKDFYLNTLINDAPNEKYSRFYLTSPTLTKGLYQVNLTLKDKAENSYTFPSFYLSLNQLAKTNTFQSSNNEIINQPSQPETSSLTNPNSTFQPSFPSSFLPKSPFNFFNWIRDFFRRILKLP